ncbi:MAG: DUF2510 domain-containing protein, partial [Acidimicrobiia bacterium]|nr:DUF2510 domain-containing protein [Acidimicrobiia bacterium]
MSGGTEAGWHNDPLGRHESRYWDGTQWTEHVSDAGVQSTDPLEQAAQPGGVVDPTQTIVTGGAPTAPMPSAPAADGLPQYANSGAQKSGGFPIVPVVLGLVAAAVVIGALVFFIGGDDKGGGGEIGASTATLDADSPVVTYEVTLDRGEGIRFRAAGADSDLDPVFAMGVSEDEANALFSDLVAEEFFSDGEATLGELFSDIADDTLSDYPPGDTG